MDEATPRPSSGPPEPIHRMVRRAVAAFPTRIAVAGPAGRLTYGELAVRVDALAARNQLSDGTVPVEGMHQLDTEVRTAADRLRSLVRSSRGLWGPVGDARQKLVQSFGKQHAVRHVGHEYGIGDVYVLDR